MKKILLSAAAIALMTSAAHADADIKTLFANAKGHTPSGYVCFARIYDDAHMKAHPQQYVRKIRLLAAYDDEMKDLRSVSLTLEAMFRNRKAALRLGGGCDLVAGDEPTQCPIGCDQGQIEVKLRDRDTLIMTLPAHPTLWRPTARDPDAGVDNAMGSDDRVFRLDSAPLNACIGLGAAKKDEAVLRSAK